jgi:glutamate/tyrosine decarboxylase-like PLP-dependent enzyme
MRDQDTAAIFDWYSDEVVSFLNDVSDLPVTSEVAPQDIRHHLQSHFDFSQPRPALEVLDDVRSMLRRWNVHVTHPRCFGYFNPSVSPESIVGDAMVALYNPQLAVWSHAPAAVEIEQHVLGLLMQKFGFDAQTSAASFTTGGAEANLTALVAALTRAFPEYGDDGLAASGARPTVYISAGGHESVVKAAHMVGIGRRAVRTIPIDDKLRMNLETLSHRIKEDRQKGCQPLMVVGTAGTTAAGIIDPLPQIGRLCRDENMWFHADAAWGGAAILSDTLAPALGGIERADSITCDAHKWLSVPMGAGMILCRHRDAIRQAFRISTGYMPATTDQAADPYISSVQWSRRCIGLKVFMPLAILGIDGVVERIDHQAAIGRRLRDVLTDSGWDVLNDTPFPLVCFTNESIGNDLAKAQAIADHVVASGEAWISHIVLSNDRPALRACISSFRTTELDVERLVAALAVAVEAQ